MNDRIKQAIEADVRTDIPFECKIGHKQASLHVLIEPDPHGNGNGEHAHFHTVISCRSLIIAEYPEPDRCEITGTTCAFWESFGGYNRDSDSRKWLYANHIIQSMACIELHGSQIVNGILKSKGTQNKQQLRLFDIAKLLIVSDSINQETYQTLENLRKTRNELAHYPYAHLEFQEEQLFQLLQDAKETLHLLAKQAFTNFESK